MNDYCGSRSPGPASRFSLGLLDELQGVCLPRPRLREGSMGVGFDRLVTTFLKNSG
jgi:hypothetical protein